MPRRWRNRRVSFNDLSYQYYVDEMFEGMSNPQLEAALIKTLHYIFRKLDQAQEQEQKVLAPDEQKSPVE